MFKPIQDRFTFLNSKHQNIGTLKDGIFRKRVYASRHLFKLMDAWGIQSDVVKDLHSQDCKEIRIKDMETQTVYAISLSDFNIYAVERDYGDGKQMFVSRKYFTLSYPQE